MSRQTRELQLGTSQIFGLLIADSFTALASIAVALYFSWKLTLVLLATLPVSALVLSLATKRLEPAIQAQRRDLATASKHATASITAIDLVKVFNGYEHELWQYAQALRKAAKHYMIQARCNSVQMGYVAFWVIAMFVVGFWYGVSLVEDGLSPGSVLTTFYATLGAFQGIEALMPHWLALAKGMSAGAFLQAVTSSADGSRRDRNTDRTVRPSACAGDIELTDVSFAYPSNPHVKVLSRSSMFFPAGDVTFIVGRSGSGKSTIGNLISNFYEPLTGDVQVDGASMRVLDAKWVQENITLIQQSSVLFNETFFKNVAFGHANPDKVTEEEVLNACDSAMLQATIARLPQGLETNVGSDGHNLSGGQKQRLTLARVRLRDPPVLILDEITSGLDQVSRALVMDAIREWRTNKTTIIITHDVSQIEDDDFVYVMDRSHLVQEGFKKSLLKQEEGHFAALVSPPEEHDPDCPVIKITSPDTTTNFSPDTPLVHSRSTRMADLFMGEVESNTAQVNGSGRPQNISLGAGTDVAYRLRLSQVFDSDEEHPARIPSFHADDWDWDVQRKRLSSFLAQRFSLPTERREASPDRNSVSSPTPVQVPSSKLAQSHQKSASAPFLSPAYKARPVSRSRSPSPPLEGGMPLGDVDKDNPFGDSSSPTNYKTKDEEEVIFGTLTRSLAATDPDATLSDPSTDPLPPAPTKAPRKKDSLLTTLETVWPTLSSRDRLVLIFGVIICVVGSVSTPVFSYCFAQLLGVMTSPGDMMSRGMPWALAMLGIAIIDGLSLGFSRYMLQHVGQAWVNSVRSEALRRILLQPKPWFGKAKNSPGRVNECLDRNAEEMRNIVGKFVPIILTVTTMISVSIIWALMVSWKLTLVALAPLPVVVGAVKGFTIISGKWESKCNKGAEEASATFTEIFLNIRVVRALTLEKYFRTKYFKLVADTLGIGLKRAAHSCSLYGAYQSIGYALTSLVFYYGTVLLAGKKELTVAEVMQVVNLLLFSIGTATGMLSSIPQLTMTQATAGQMLGYANMSTEPPEGQKGKITLDSPLPIKMTDLSFSYSRHPNDRVLKGTSLVIRPGKCTAIVGHSGCGKSTALSLLMGLYVPSNPSSLTFGGISSAQMDIQALRSSMAYVSQAPFLFPVSVAENITYGLPDNSPHRQTPAILRAADAAGLHEWIVSLPQGYSTVIGDGGQALSGGQAQRLSIARALVRRPKLLILDEPTSALDAESADAIRQTLRDITCGSEGVAVVMVTHSREMMRLADWIVVLAEGGRAVEGGVWEDLMSSKGEFARLVRGGALAGEA